MKIIRNPFKPYRKMRQSWQKIRNDVTGGTIWVNKVDEIRPRLWMKAMMITPLVYIERN